MQCDSSSLAWLSGNHPSPTPPSAHTLHVLKPTPPPTMASLTCFPDECLSQTHLNVLFNGPCRFPVNVPRFSLTTIDFRVANDSGLSDAAVFSSLVNNVHLPAYFHNPTLTLSRSVTYTWPHFSEPARKSSSATVSTRCLCMTQALLIPGLLLIPRPQLRPS